MEQDFTRDQLEALIESAVQIQTEATENSTLYILTFAHGGQSAIAQIIFEEAGLFERLQTARELLSAANADSSLF